MENINVIESEIDLRYILAKFDLIITSRATSTVGWCAMTDKPLVFLEMHDNQLSSHAREAFERAFSLSLSLSLFLMLWMLNFIVICWNFSVSHSRKF